MVLQAIHHIGDTIDRDGDLTVSQYIIGNEENAQDVIQMSMGQQDMVNLGLVLQAQSGGCASRIQQISLVYQKTGEVKSLTLTAEATEHSKFHNRFPFPSAGYRCRPSFAPHLLGW
jgi:hypothetical protein